MLKSQADYLITEHPHLSGQIQAGLLLAVAGRVSPVGDPAESLTRNWEVLGETYEKGVRNQGLGDGKELSPTDPRPLTPGPWPLLQGIYR